MLRKTTPPTVRYVRNPILNDVQDFDEMIGY